MKLKKKNKKKNRRLQYDFGAILAGGTGSRMANHGIPKQFIELCGKPIIIRTIEKCFLLNLFDYLFIAIHPTIRII